MLLCKYFHCELCIFSSPVRRREEKSLAEPWSRAGCLWPATAAAPRARLGAGSGPACPLAPPGCQGPAAGTSQGPSSPFPPGPLLSLLLLGFLMCPSPNEAIFPYLQLAGGLQGTPRVPGGCWGAPQLLGGSHRSWGTSSSSKATASALELPHRLPRQGGSDAGARLWQVQRSREAPSHVFRCWPGDAGKRPGCAAGLSLRMEGYGDAAARARLGALWGSDPTPTPTSAPRRLCRSSAAPEMCPSSPCGFLSPSTKVPPASASPGVRQERLGAAHRAALLIPPS